MRDSDNLDELRRFVLEHPNVPETADAQRRIVELEFRSARAAGTRLAYSLFLERYPDSPQAIQVANLLEDYDFSAIGSTNSLLELRAFLRRYPRGEHVTLVRQRLELLECKLWGASKDLYQLLSTIRDHSEWPCAEALRAHASLLAFDAAMASTTPDPLIRYLFDHPSSETTRRAQQRLVELQIGPLLRAALFERAEHLVQKYAGAREAEEWRVQIRQARWRWQIAAFRADAFDNASELPRSTGFPTASEWRVWLHKWPKAADLLAGHTSIVRRAGLVPSAPDLGVDFDPLLRWTRAEYLSDFAEENSADQLYAMFDDQYLEVRRQAWLGLERIIPALGVTRSEAWIGENRNRIRAKAQAGSLLLKIGILEFLAGNPAQAFGIAEQVASESEDPDLLALALAIRASTRLSRPKAAQSFARRFDEAAVQYSRQRRQVFTDFSISESGINRGGWLVVRQLTGLARLWSDVLHHVAVANSTASELVQKNDRWLQESRGHLEDLVRWLRDEEDRLGRAFPEFVPAYAVPSSPMLPQENIADIWHALVDLAFSEQPAAHATVTWASCCHPHLKVRSLAVSVAFLQRLAISFHPLPFGPK